MDAGPLFGRAVELAAVGRFVASAARGSSRVLLLTGEAGVGKSRLVGEAVEMARRADLRVLLGRATTRTGAYRPFAEALLRATGDLDPEAVPGLRPYRVALGRLLPGWAASDDRPEPIIDPVLVLGEGVTRLLRHLAADVGCLLVLEDLHWADADTLALLEYLADALRDVPVLVVASARDDEPGSSAAGRLAAFPAVLTLPVARLERTDLATLIASRAGGRVLPDSVDSLLDRADGLPLLAEELVDAAVGRDAGTVGPAPRTFSALVGRRMAALSPAHQRCLAAAAMTGTDRDWALLPEVTGASEEAVLGTARAATQAHLLRDHDGTLRWRHALTRDAVLATLLPPERAALARRSGEALLRRARPEDAARAAELLAEGGERDRAAAAFLDLARNDRVHGALRRAEHLLDRAEAVGAPAAALALERVALLTLSGQVGSALDTGDAALAGAQGEEHAQLCLRLARAAIIAARWSDAEAYIARAGRPEDPHSLVLAADSAYGAGDVPRAVRLATTAVEQAERAGSPSVLCEALDVAGRVERLGDPAAARATFSRAAQVAAEHRLVPQRVAALVGVGTVELAEAEISASLVEARELAQEAGLLAQASGAEVMLLEHVMLEHGPRAAEDLGRDLLERGTRLRLPEVQVAGAYSVALARAADGDLVGMEAGLAGMLLADPMPEVAALRPAVRAVPRLLAHDLAGANALLHSGMVPLVDHWVAAPLHQFGLWALLRTVVDDRGDAARTALRVLPAARRPANRGALRYADAVAAARVGRTSEAAGLLAAGDADLAGLPWLHRLLHLLVLEAMVTDGWGDPVPRLRQDLAEHDRAGEHQQARTCRDLLRRAGAPTRRGRGSTPVPPALRAAGVTSREMDVLALTSAGLSNAEIAARLYLSRRTVETHVASLLAKLGAADRRELRARTATQTR